MLFAVDEVEECKAKVNETVNACPIVDPSPEEEEESRLRMEYEDEDNESDKKKQSQRQNEPPSDEEMDADGKPTRRNNIPLLTGSVQVGMLYDAKSDQPLYGDYLWPPANKPQIIEANVSHSSMDYIFDESILDRLSLIDVDAELKLSFMTGMIQVIIFFDSEYVTFLLKVYLFLDFWKCSIFA